MPKQDYYEILGVSRTASADEIKKAFKKLARQHHPDRNQGNKAAEDKFKAVNEAYQVLSNPEKRKTYDLFGHDGPVGAPGPGAGPYGGYGGQRVYDFSGGGGTINFEDIFGGAGGGGGGIGDIFSEMFGGAGRSRKRRADFGGFGGYDEPGPVPGRDVEAEITVSFEDAMRGGTHRLQFSRQAACADCGGTGHNRSGRSRNCAACGGAGKKQVAGGGSNFNVVCSACSGTGKVHTEPCHTCYGQGQVMSPETITVKIPPGVNDGGRLRIPGKGESGPGGQGDLFLHIRVTPHPYFRREGRDLHLEVPVTVSEAALGAKIEVPTLDGRATVKVGAGTQTGATLRLRGKGAPSPKGAAAGDLLVHVRVVVPEDPDAETRRILEELKAREPDPRAGKF